MTLEQNVADFDMSTGRGCWYHFTLWECPDCGRQDSYKERKPPPKPDSYLDIVDYDYLPGCHCLL
jgi:hypothetical protein